MAGIADRNAEWLEADGLGGFASGTVGGIHRRRYHALLLAASRPPTGRYVLVNGFDASVTTSAGTLPLSSQRYEPGVVHPDGALRIAAFRRDPWPQWSFHLEDGSVIEQEIFVRRGAALAALAWRRRGGRSGCTLTVRPFLSGRDYHALHHENPAFRFDAEGGDGRWTWRPYPGVPAVTALTNGRYLEERLWYRNFLYEEERARGLDAIEDLAAPGAFQFDLGRGEAVLILAAGEAAPAGEAGKVFRSLRAAERRRRGRFPSALHRAADDYIVPRGDGLTIVAGYPWFADWGRDTFIALRGLCLATGRLEEARAVLLGWSGAVSEGMLPNRFPDQGGEPEFNAVDASLWYIVAVHDYLRAVKAAGRRVPGRDRGRFAATVDAILSRYAGGTRYGIRMDEDGLLAAGIPGVPLTWMDAKVGDRLVTPRIGKPVEVQALWLNSLRIASAFSDRWGKLFDRGLESFRTRFWYEGGGWLHDVVDPGHRRGEADSTFRPNQIFAVGGLPLPLIEGERARRVVSAVESRLWTPLGLRSLAPGEPGYAPRYEGGVRERDGAYHQGTVWPWLLGPFVEAWVRVRGGGPDVRSEAKDRFLRPLLAHLEEAGLGHISEITDAEPPHAARGCPFQAWSVGEALRLSEAVLAEEGPAAGSSARARRRPSGSR